jgi:DNA-binding CsgD family transcriptional regulator
MSEEPSGEKTAGRNRPSRKACGSCPAPRRRTGRAPERSFGSGLGISLEELERALDTIGLSIFVLDRARVVRWLNSRATKLLGPIRGHGFDGIVAPEDRHAVRGQLAKLLIGSSEAIDFEIVLLDRAGRRLPVHASFVPLVTAAEGVVGILGAAVSANPREVDGTSDANRRLPPELTPRQHEVLRLLSEGRGTTEIAATLGVSHETARNHIRAVLVRLGAHSRLEAVALAQRLSDVSERSPTVVPDGSRNAPKPRIATQNQNDPNASRTESVAAGTLDDKTDQSDQGDSPGGWNDMREAS